MKKYWLAFGGFFALTFFSCTKVLHQTDTTVQVYQMEENVAKQSSNSSVIALITPYKTALDAEMNTEVGRCTKRLEKTQPESTLGNWMADALLSEAQIVFDVPIDFAVQNYGGVRVPYLPEGSITKGNIFELMPFENRMVVLKVEGSTVQTLFDHIATLGGWPISQNVSFEIRDSTNAKNIMIRQKPLDTNQNYTFVLPDYIANGGDNCSFLSNYVERKDSEKLIRDSFFDYLKKNPVLNAEIEGRVIYNE